MSIQTNQRFRSALEPILNDLLAKSHPKMVRLLLQSAVPYWINRSILAEIRQKEDQKEDGILERLDRFSFFFSRNLPFDKDAEVDYVIDELERDIFNRRFIDEDPEAYRSTHAAIHRFWQEADSHLDPRYQDRNRLYHYFFVDCRAAMAEMRSLIRTWINDRELTAVDELVKTADDALVYLNRLNENQALPPDGKWPIKQLEQTLIIYKARLAQVRGNLTRSEEILSTFGMADEAAEPEVKPYINLLRGYIEEDRRNYAASIDYFEAAVAQFNTLIKEESSTDRLTGLAEAQLARGGAYSTLSSAAGGNRTEPIRPSQGIIARLGDFLQFLISLPLAISLGPSLGRRVFHPSVWHLFRDADWIRTRFYGLGISLYHMADPILETYLPALSDLADERLARIWLDLGAADAAYEQYSEILENGRPSRFRTAAIQISQADALVRLDRTDDAQGLIDLALPTVEEYGDRQMEGEAHALLGEIYLAKGERQAAIAAFRTAVEKFDEAGLPAQATASWEQLDKLTAADKPLAVEGEQRLIYTRRYRHWTTRLIRRLIVVLFSAGTFLGFTLLFRLGNQSTVSPSLTFQASPILNPDSPASSIDIGSAGSLGFNPLAAVELQSLFWWAVIFILLYLLTMTSLGVWVIRRIRPRDIESDSLGRSMIVTQTGLQQGEDGTPMRFEEIQRVIRADQSILLDTLQDESLTILTDGKQQINIPGSIIGYSDLVDRIKRNAPKAKRRNLSYSYLMSWMGALYYLTLTFFVITTLLAALGNTDILATPFFRRYSIINLYPWTFMGLYIPTIWWFVIAPTRIYHHLDREIWFPRYLLGTALFFFLLLFWRANLQLRTYPDIYVPLTALICALCGTYLFIRLWSPKPGNRRRFLFPLVIIGAILITLGSSLYLIRETRIYHNQILGNSYRDDILENGENSASLERANFYYTQAIEQAESNFLIPTISDSILADIYGSRGLILLGSQTQVGSVSEVLSPIERSAVESSGDEIDDVTIIGSDGSEETNPEDQFDYEPAIADFTMAHELVPNQAKYLLWRAYLHHSEEEFGAASRDYQAALDIRGEGRLDRLQATKALTGMGWIAYHESLFVESDELLRTAISLYEPPASRAPDPSNPLPAAEFAADAWLGLGYTLYFEDEGLNPVPDKYEMARDAWQRSVELDATDPLPFINLGASYWRLATLGTETNDIGRVIKNQCSSIYPDEVRAQAETNLIASEESFLRSLTLDGQTEREKGFTYRTLGQIAFLQGTCPTTEESAAYQKGVDFYGEAIGLDPENAHYHHMQGRLAYVAWGASTVIGAQSRVVLMDGLDAANRSIALNPNGPDYQRWRDIIFEQAESGSLRRGNDARESGNLELAVGYYELVADRIPSNIEAPFLAAEVRIALDDEEAALAWVDLAIERARELGEEAAIIEAYKRLPANTPAAILDRFEQEGFDYTQTSSAQEAFDLALDAYRAGDEAQGLPLFELGLELAKREKSLASVRIGITQILMAEENWNYPTEPYLSLLSSDIDNLRQVAEDNGENSLALDLGYLGLVLNDIELAAIGYNEGIRRTTAGNFGSLRSTEAQFLTLWQTSGAVTQGSALLRAMEADMPSHLNLYPEQRNNGFFWRTRGWFKYYIGASAFRLGWDEVALEALASAQPDADRAAELGAEGRFIINTYLPQGAIGWYYFLRGDDLLNVGDLDAARESYQAGAIAYARALDPNNVNPTAANELIDILFKAAEVDLLIGNGNEAERFVDAALDSAEAFGGALNLDERISDLESLDLDAYPSSAAVREEIIEDLSNWNR